MENQLAQQMNRHSGFWFDFAVVNAHNVYSSKSVVVAAAVSAATRRSIPYSSDAVRV